MLTYSICLFTWNQCKWPMRMTYSSKLHLYCGTVIIPWEIRQLHPLLYVLLDRQMLYAMIILLWAKYGWGVPLSRKVKLKRFFPNLSLILKTSVLCNTLSIENGSFCTFIRDIYQQPFFLWLDLWPESFQFTKQAPITSRSIYPIIWLTYPWTQFIWAAFICLKWCNSNTRTSPVSAAFCMLETTWSSCIYSFDKNLFCCNLQPNHP